MPLSDIPRETLAQGRANWYAKLGHTPKLGQRLMDEAVDAGKRFLGLFTPPQDGKSYSVSKHIGSYFLIPDVHAWIVSPTYQDGKKEFGYLYEDFGRMGILRSARRKHFDIRGGNMHIELANGSWVEVVSADNEENLRREQVDILILAEASKLPSNLFQSKLYARLERRRGLCFIPSTFRGHNWVEQDFRAPSLPVKPGSWRWGPWREAPGGAVRERIGGEPNPAYDSDYWSTQVSYAEDFGEVLHRGEFTPDQIAKARLRLPPPMFAEQFGGEAASYAGLCLPFDPARNECDPFRIPDGWTHLIGYDHGAGGGSDPTAILFGSYGPDGTLYWWGEIYDEQVRAIESRASLIRVMLRGKRPAWLVRGHEAKQVGKELQDAGLPNTFPKDGGPLARIIRHTELMKTGHWRILRGTCPNLRRECLSYEWDERDPGKPKDGNDHCIEAAGNAALMPVSLPDASLAVAEESPEDRGARIRRDRLWGAYERDQRAGQRSGKAARLEALLEPDLLAETGVVAEWVAR